MSVKTRYNKYVIIDHILTKYRFVYVVMYMYMFRKILDVDSIIWHYYKVIHSIIL